jgi:tetratricopeptide (TPR) repeat protein
LRSGNIAQPTIRYEMNLPHQSRMTADQPALADLFREYLNRQAQAGSAGFAGADAQGEVIPYEAAPAAPLDLGLAWREATAVASHFFKDAANVVMPIPADWPAFVSAHEAEAAVTFSFSHFPQLVRDLRSLIDAQPLSSLLCTASQPLPATAVEDWAAISLRKSTYPMPLLAAGLLRFARQFDRAAELLQECRADVPSHWQAAWANEAAALEWHRGRRDRAIDLWKSQSPSPPVLFNRGMAALFQDRPAEARTCLSEAVSLLPEESGWHHLARLYLTLAEIRA